MQIILRITANKAQESARERLPKLRQQTIGSDQVQAI
jgi:hypothetical protein